MKTASSTYLASNAQAVKAPVYLLHFDGQTTDYCTSTRIGSPTNTLKAYLEVPKGQSRQITPEEGRSSVGQVTCGLLDHDGEITALIANDAYNLHRKKAVLKAGYADMDEADMLEILTGWVTDIRLWRDGAGYDVVISDLQRWLQRKIFRGAEDEPVILSGNPLNILLAVLTSTGAGTNGDYDWYDAENAVGIDQDLVAVSHIEEIRDHWFPGVKFFFDIRQRMTAKRFVEGEILKPCGLYPAVRGNGLYDVIHTNPPYGLSTNQAFDDDVIMGVPSWDQNLSAMINEISFQVDHDADTGDYDSEYFYTDSTSVANRGPGKQPLEVKSKGIRTSMRGEAFIDRRATQVLARYAAPPPKVSVQAFFSRHLSEPGDIVPVTNDALPDLQTGSRGLSARYMEIIESSVDYRKGVCRITLLDTDWTGMRWGAISPVMTITGVTDREHFTVSVADAAKYAVLTEPEVQIRDEMARQKVSAVTVLSVNTTTGAVEIDNAGMDLEVGWKVLFADYDHCTSEQRRYGFIADSSNKLGAADDAPYYIMP